MSGGTRARFFASQNTNISSASINTAHTESTQSLENETNSLPRPTSTSSEPSSLSVSLVPFSRRNTLADPSHSPREASDNSDEEIIAQRTRTTETETLYKAKKERHGKLNVAGLMKYKDSSNTSSLEAAPQRATIKEVAENDEIDARSPRQYSNNKLISKINASSASNSPHFTLPPSTQLSSKMPPSRQISHPNPSISDSFWDNTSSSASRFEPNNPHITTLSSSDDRIKGLTTAFNRRHTVASRPAPPRFASPILKVSNVEGSAVSSPRLNLEDDPMADSGDTVVSGSIQRQKTDYRMERDENGFDEDTYMRIGRAGAESHLYNDSRGIRGEKRSSGSADVEVSTGTHGGKRARTENYDEFPPRHENSRISVSPEPDFRIDQQTRPKDASLSGAHASSEDPFARADPRLKIFLGQDVDEYIAAHIDRYEAAKKHWAECSREEWERGAEELVERFTGVLDFVKEHVKRKVTLYASLHAKIDEHQKTREATAVVLKEAKCKLVAKTGVVVDKGPMSATI